MAEYIEREALIKQLKDEIEGCGDAHISDRPIAYGTILGLKSALSYAKTLPSADVVEAVRCKDCVYGKGNDYEGNIKVPFMYHCTYDDLSYNGAEHFCSYGVRKEGAEE